MKLNNIKNNTCVHVVLDYIFKTTKREKKALRQFSQ